MYRFTVLQKYFKDKLMKFFLQLETLVEMFSS